MAGVFWLLVLSRKLTDRGRRGVQIVRAQCLRLCHGCHSHVSWSGFLLHLLCQLLGRCQIQYEKKLSLTFSAKSDWRNSGEYSKFVPAETSTGSNGLGGGVFEVDIRTLASSCSNNFTAK